MNFKLYLYALLIIPIQLLGQGGGMPVSVTKSLNVLGNVNYSGSIELSNPTNETLYLRIFDDNGILINQEAIYPGSSGATPFSFTASNTAQYQLWIGFDQGFNNASFSIDNFSLSYSETTMEQVCSTDDSYRYGFNGMEKDDEIKGVGNSYDYGARMYDPRLGRWLSIDRLYARYPEMSYYSFAANSPIILFDTDGKKIINGYQKQLTAANEKLSLATENVANYKASLSGDPSKEQMKELKSLEKDLKTATKNRDNIQESYDKVEQIVKTYKAADPDNYNYFEELKTSTGEDINIIIQLDPSSSGSAGQSAQTAHINGYNKRQPIKDNLITDEDGEVVDFNIDAYPKLPQDTDFGKKGSPGAIITLYRNGQGPSTLANEFGDVHYIINVLTTYKTLQAHAGNAGQSDTEYRSGGSGKYSFDFEDAWDSKMKEYKTANGLSSSDFDSSGNLINLPSDDTPSETPSE